MDLIILEISYDFSSISLLGVIVMLAIAALLFYILRLNDQLTQCKLADSSREKELLWLYEKIKSQDWESINWKYNEIFKIGDYLESLDKKK